MINPYKGIKKVATTAMDSLINKTTNTELRTKLQARKQYAQDMAGESSNVISAEAYKSQVWDHGIREELGVNNRTNSRTIANLIGEEVSPAKYANKTVAVDHMPSNYRQTVNKGLSWTDNNGEKQAMQYVDTSNVAETQLLAMDSNNPTVAGIPLSMLTSVLPRNRMFSYMMRKLNMREYVGESIQAGQLWDKQIMVMFEDFTMNPLQDITLYSDGNYEGYTNMNITAEVVPVINMQEVVRIGVQEQGVMARANIDLMAKKTELAVVSDRNKKDLIMTLGYAPAGLKGYLNYGIPREDLPAPDLSNVTNLYNNLRYILGNFMHILQGHADLDLEIKIGLPPVYMQTLITLFPTFPLAGRGVIDANMRYSFEPLPNLSASITGLPNDVMLVTAYMPDREFNPAMEIFTTELAIQGVPQTQGTVQIYTYSSQWSSIFIPFSQLINIYNLQAL